MKIQPLKTISTRLLVIIVGIGLLLPLSPESTMALKQLSKNEMRGVTAKEGIQIATFLEIGAPLSGGSMRLNLRDNGGDRDPQAGDTSGNTGRVIFRFQDGTPGESIKLSDNGGTGGAGMTLNVDEQEGAVFRIENADLDGGLSDLFIGPSQPQDTIGAFEIDGMTLDGSFVKLKVR